MITVEIPWAWLAEREKLNLYLIPGTARLAVNGQEVIVMGITYGGYTTLENGGLQLDCKTKDELELQRMPLLELQVQTLRDQLLEAGLEPKL